MRSPFFLALVLLIVSCQTKSSEAILPPEKMETVLFDFAMADAHTNINVNIDSVILAQKENTKLQKKIFAIHGITREQFKQSFEYYTKHPAEFTTILDSISAKENRRNTAPIISKYE